MALGLLVGAPVTQAARSDTPPLPWAGGLSVETPFEVLAERGKTCQVGTQVTFQPKTVRVKTTRRLKIRGRWHIRVVWATRTTRVPVQTPRYGECPDYMNRVFAVQTISHESQHLAGIRDEATAECNGMQDLAWFARQFGEIPDQARQMAYDYYHDFYEIERPGTPYYLATCPDPTG